MYFSRRTCPTTTISTTYASYQKMTVKRPTVCGSDGDVQVKTVRTLSFHADLAQKLPRNISARSKQTYTFYTYYVSYRETNLYTLTVVRKCKHILLNLSRSYYYIFFICRFKDKTRNDWYDRANFEKVSGKYDLVELDYSANVSLFNCLSVSHTSKNTFAYNRKVMV